MKTKTVKELHPRRFPGHRLLPERSLSGCIPGEEFITVPGKFFNKTAFKLKEGWALKGFATPPYQHADGENRDAIVFEKLSPSSEETGNYWDKLEPGYYWIHGNANSLRFKV